MKFVPKGITQKIGKQILLAKKDSPKVLFALGIAGVVGSTILACRATLKLDEKLEAFHEEVELTKNKNEERNDADSRKALAVVYTKNSIGIVKLYAPSVLLSAASIGALTSSHVTLQRRNSALGAAYATVAASFEAYRERVRAEVGTEKELDIHHAVTPHKITIGTKTDTVKVADPNKWSPYAQFFEESNYNWKKDAELNKIFIIAQQNCANHILQARGHIFLNEVYEMLGMEPTQAGQCVGWVLGDHGDNVIDFGLFEAANSAFIKGWERNVLLDFNVDGVILNMVNWRRG